MEWFTTLRNILFRVFYRGFLKPLFFLTDPEWIHKRFIALGKALGGNLVTRNLTKFLFAYKNPALEQTILGIRFSNPLGLAAGFDKNGELTELMSSVGFGFEEIGSVTGESCAGNSGRHLWRLKKDRSLVVYYGLKNNGCLEISERLSTKQSKIPVGVSIAKTNDQQTISEEAGIRDYLKAYATFVKKNIGDYFTINISCPNTFGGEPFIDPQKLHRLLTVIAKARDFYQSRAPIFLKLPADLEEKTLDEIISIARAHSISGFICSNLVKDRANVSLQEKDIPPVGGLSGKPTKDFSTRLIRYIYKKTGKEFVIIGCGGIFSANDAYEKIKAGASLLELITGMIFEGPQLISEINQGLVKLLKKDGYSSISQAVGREK